MSRRRFALLVPASALALTMSMALAGCSGSDEEPVPTAVTTADDAPSTEAEETSDDTETDASDEQWSVSDDDLGVSFTTEIPAGWEDTVKESMPVLLSNEPVDDFSANIFAKFQSVPEGATIEAIAANFVAEVSALPEWTTSTPDGEQTTLGGHTAFGISGLYESEYGSLAQQLTVVLVDGADGPVVVQLVATTAPDDATAQDLITDLLETISFN